jgi:hypothetical protein
MSKNNSSKAERQLVRRLINQGLYDEVEELHNNDEYEHFLEKQERKVTKKSPTNKKMKLNDN